VTEIKIRESTESDKAWIREVFSEQWGAQVVVSKGKLHDCDNLQGLIAERIPMNAKIFPGKCPGMPCGLLTYRIENSECEIITLNSFIEKAGVASLLIKSVMEKAIRADCSRLWLITTNDNTNAIEFYRKRGFNLIEVRKGVMAEYRKLKPQIPEIGESGIPITDELEFELRLIS
jgi:N-acetylglutamate synthase-like GNAT family acetyltransferase